MAESPARPHRRVFPARLAAAGFALAVLLAPRAAAAQSCTSLQVAVGALQAQAGEPVNVTVTALTSTPNVCTAYTGTVALSDSADSHFSASPAAHTFAAGDNGQFTFQVTFGSTGGSNGSGFQTVHASDGTISGNALATPVTQALYSDGSSSQSLGTAAVNPASPATTSLSVRLSNGATLASAALAAGFGGSGNPNDFVVGAFTGCNVSGAVQTCTVPVQFTPSRPGLRQAPLLLTDNSGNQYYLGLSGTGSGGALAFTPGVINRLVLTAGQDVVFGSVDSAGDVYIVDQTNRTIQERTTAGALTTIVGGGTNASPTLPAPATSVSLSAPRMARPDAAGNLYVVLGGDNVILRLDRNTGELYQVAGVFTNGVGGSSGDNGPAGAAGLSAPADVEVDGSGNLFIADTSNCAVRRVDAVSGIITDYAGQTGSCATGTAPAFNGSDATAQKFGQITGLALDAAGNAYVSDVTLGAVFKIAPGGGNKGGAISLFAGDCASGGACQTSATPTGDGFTSDSSSGGPVKLGSPEQLALDTAGDLYVADKAQNVVWRVDANSAAPGTIHIIAGNGAPAAGIGDGGAATDAKLTSPFGVWVDSVGTVYIGDGSGEVRSVPVTLGQFRDFHSVLLGTTSAAQSLLITNVGNSGFTVSTFATAPSPGDFSQPAASGCGATLNPGLGCTVSVTYAPTHTGAEAGTVSVANSLSNTNATANLAGTGVQATVSPSSFLFTSNGGAASAAQTFTLTNPATSQSLSVSGVAVVQSGATDFSGHYLPLTSNNCSTVAASSTCTVTVTFTPGAGATYPEPATLQFSDTVVGGGAPGNAPQTSTLNGALQVPPTGAATSAGGGQSATIGTQYGSALKLAVTGSGGAPSPGVSVTFTAPASGASAVFSDTGTNTETVITDVNGVATSAAFYANQTSGAVAIGAAVGSGCTGTCSATFSESNVALTEPVGSSLQMTYFFGIGGLSGGAVSDIQVLTEGQSNQDYTRVTSGALATDCRANFAYSASQFCTVQVQFQPKAPGLRPGAVVLFGGSSAPATAQATTFVGGTGTGPALAYNPGTPSASALAAAASAPLGVAVDPAGNLFYVSSGDGAIKEIAAGTTTPVTLATDGNSPLFLALDGAGNIAVTDSNGLFTLPALDGGSYGAHASVSISSAQDVASDGTGTFYVLVTSPSFGIKTYRFGGSVSGSTAAISGLNGPAGMSYDAQNGMLLIADSGNVQIYAVPVTGGTAVAQTIHGVTLNSPTGAVADAAGNLYVADSGTGTVYEQPANGANAVVISGGISPALTPGGTITPALDAAGNVYAPDSGTSSNANIYKIRLGTAPTLSFGTTPRNATGSSETVEADNIGNTALTFASNPAPGTANFSYATTGGSPCGTASPLAVGGICNLVVTFTPKSFGALSDTLTLTDNALNGGNAVQTLALSGAGGIGPAAKLAFAQQPSNAAFNTAIAPAVTVSVEDAEGNVVTTDASNVTVAIGTNPGGGTLAGTTTAAAVNGVATFSNLSINQSGTGYTLAATDGSLTQAASSAFNIAGSPAKLAFTVQPPATGTAGQALAPAIQVSVEDSNGNVVTSDTSLVTVAKSSGPGTLSGTAAVSAVAGVATFSGLSFNLSGTYALAATDGSLTGATSTNVAIGAGPATQLVFTQQPTDTTSQAAISPAVTVAEEDANGNVETGDNSTQISLAIAHNTGGGALTGGTGTVVAAGVATFGALTINKAGTGYTLGATAGSLQQTSSAFNITPGTAASLAVLIGNSANTGFAAGVSVTALDAAGNTATGYSGTVRFSSSDAAAQLPANTALSNGVFNGQVSFETPGGGSTVTATDTVTSTLTGTSGAVAVANLSEPLGQTTATQTVILTVTRAGQPAAINVLTLGKASSDFAAAAGGTCSTSTSYTAGQTCTANVTFAPGAAGLRQGAVTLTDTNGNVLGTTLFGAIGTAPMILYPETLNGTVNVGNASLTIQGIALDGNGNAYVVDTHANLVYKIPLAGGTPAAIGTTTAPTNVAVDGAGSVYILDSGSILKIAPTGAQSTINCAGNCASAGLGTTGLAVDAAGDLWVAASGRITVLRANGSTQQALCSACGSTLGGIAVDASGNVFVTDTNNNRIAQFPAGNVFGNSPSFITQAGGTALSGPSALSADGFGNLYVTDNNALYEIPAGAPASAVTFGKQQLSIRQAVADASGNVYVAGLAGIFQYVQGTAPTLAFGNQTAGTTSATQSTTVRNGGNAALTFAASNGVAFDANFPNQSSTCSSGGTVSAGEACTISVAFAPQGAASFAPPTDAVTLTDNSLNGTNVAQTIGLTGTGVKTNQAISFSGPGAQTYGVAPLTLSATGGASGNPVVFTVVSGPGRVSGTNGTTLTVAGAGTIVVATNQAGSISFNAAAQVTQNVVVSPKALTIIGLAASNKIYDGTTTAAITGTGTLSGVVGSDQVSLQGTPAGTFASPSVANSITVVVGGLSLTGAQQADYTLLADQLAANITPATLTVTGLSASNKVYDRTTAATLAGAAAISGGAPTGVALTGTPAGTFAAAGVANGVAVAVTGLSLTGSNAGNYTLSAQALSANITPATLTVTGLAASNKVYDGTTAATITGTGALQGVLGSDAVALGGTASGTFAQSGVGTGIAVSVGDLTLSGAQAADYALTQPAGLTANITAKGLTLTVANATRAFGADNPAFSGTLTGFVSGEGPTLVTGAAAFSTTATATSDPGAYPITATAGTLAAANYSFGTFTAGTLTVTQATQTITFGALGSHNFGDPPFAVSATASSGLPVTIRLVSGPATLSGGMVTLTGAGTVVLEADQAGNTDYAAAAAVQQSITVSAATLGVNVSTLAFGSQPVQTTSTAQTVILINTSGATFGVSAVATSGDFAATANCPAVGAGASCAISVTFTPTAVGPRTGTLTIQDDVPGSPQTVALTGTGTVSGILVTPTALIFGGQVVGTSSAAQTVTIVNTGTVDIHVAQIAVTGDYAVSGNCGTVPAGSNCSFSVTFTPTATGKRAGTVVVTDDAGGGSQTVLLSGTGAAPGAAVSPANLNFPGTVVGKTSAALTATLTNTGTATLTSIAVAAQGDFAQTTTCGTTLAAGAGCSISVTFTPTAASGETGAVTVTDNLGTQGVALAGTGLSPSVSLSNSQLIFGSQLVNTDSNAQTVVVSNPGSAALTLGTITAPAGFSFNTNCGIILAVGASCSVNFVFAPTATGPASGTATIPTGAGDQTVALQGTGVNPGLALTPSFAFFGAQIVNTTSPAQTLAATNTGTAPLTLAPITVSSDFSESDACPAMLQPGGSCLISVAFAPTALGTRAGSVTVAAQGGGVSAVATLNGQGTLPGVAIAPATMDFGSVSVGTTSHAQTVTVTNVGTAPLSLTAVGANGDFAETTNCLQASPLAPGANCVINVTMTPSTLGTRTGTIQVVDSTTGAHSVALTGLGQSAELNIFPTHLDFGSSPLPPAGSQVSLAGTVLSVTLTNIGNLPVNLNGYALQGDFNQTNGCPQTLQPNQRCVLSVTFSPTALGHRTGAITISDNADGGAQTVSLEGFGSPGGLTLTPPVLNFGVQVVGVTSAAQNAVLTNHTGEDLNNLVITPSGEYGETNGCGAALANGASCNLAITVTPVTVGDITGNVIVSGTLQTPLSGRIRAAVARPATAAANFSLGVVALTATAIPPGIGLSVPQLSFSATAVGTASTGQTITLKNTGNTLDLTHLAITGTNGTEFPFTTNCPATLAPQATCTITVNFSPTGAGLRTGFMDITADGGITAQIPESGIGIGPQLTVNPSTLVYAARPVATTSAAQTLLLQNTGGLPLSLTGMAAAGDYRITATTCSLPQTLAVNATCTVSVAFTPTTTGTRSGSITFTSNSVAGAVVVALDGSASTAGLAITPLSLAFGTQGVGVASAAQTFAVTNNSGAAVGIQGIAIAPGGNYGETSTCPASLAAGKSCLISVVFTPSTTGELDAAVDISDDAGAQTVGLTGAGSDFAITYAGNLPAAVTVNTGAKTTYHLGLTSATSDNQTIALGCSADPGFSCSLSAASVAISEANPGTFDLILTANQRYGGLPLPGAPAGRAPWAWLGLGLVSLLGAALWRRRRMPLSLAGTGLLLVFSLACGTPKVAEVPSTHFVTVTAKSSTGEQHTRTLNLVIE